MSTTPPTPTPAEESARYPLSVVVWIFVAFASAYFLSALLRAITATLSPASMRRWAPCRTQGSPGP